MPCLVKLPDCTLLPTPPLILSRQVRSLLPTRPSLRQSFSIPLLSQRPPLTMPASGLLQGLASGLRKDGRTALQLPGAGIEIDNTQVNAEQSLDNGRSAIGHVGATVSALLQGNQAPLADFIGQASHQLAQAPEPLTRNHHTRQRIKPARSLSRRDEDQ